jgi:hypothetical protein
MPKVRRVPDGRPSLAHVGNQQEAAFVDQDEMGTSVRGVFLTGAIRPASTARWRLRRAGARAVLASANSSPGRVATAPTRRPGCSGHQTVCE